jgi:hypothetical protein
LSEGRFDRQSRLAEVGTEGQERLQKARVCVGTSDGVEIERLYLARAGVERVDVGAETSIEAFTHAEAFTSPFARRFAAAAWRALGAIRRELGVHR